MLQCYKPRDNLSHHRMGRDNEAGRGVSVAPGLPRLVLLLCDGLPEYKSLMARGIPITDF